MTNSVNTGHCVNLNGAEIYYETVGQGMPIVFMHGGLGLDHTYFRPYFDELADKAQLIFYDHLGNGRSQRPDDLGELTFERFVADAEALKNHLNLEKIVLIGHSYGGFIAQEYALAHPGSLRALALLNTVPAFDYEPALSGTDEQMAALGEMFSRPMENDEEFRNNWNLISQMYYKNFNSQTGAELDEKTHYSYAAWNAANALLATFNTIEGIQNLDIPTFVAGGRHDGITPPKNGTERIGELIKNSQTVIFEESGHFPFIEEQSLFMAKLNEWLDTV